MTGLDLLAYWLGYGVIIALSLAAIFGVFAAVLTMAAQPALKTLLGMYDLYVLKWWMDRIKASGHVIPTRKAVRDVLDNLDDE